MPTYTPNHLCTPHTSNLVDCPVEREGSAEAEKNAGSNAALAVSTETCNGGLQRVEPTLSGIKVNARHDVNGNKFTALPRMRKRTFDCKWKTKYSASNPTSARCLADPNIPNGLGEIT